MSRTSSYAGRHRRPGRHRAPASGVGVRIGSVSRVVPAATGAGIVLVAAASSSITPPSAEPAAPDAALGAIDALAWRGDPLVTPGADVASRSSTRLAVAAAVAPPVPEVVPVAPAPPPAASSPAPTPAKPTPTPVSATPALGAGAQYAGAARAIGLRGYAVDVYCAVRATFGITTIGGYRAGDPGDHGTGHAVDVMISSKAQGDAVAAYAIAHAKELHVAYVIWRQRIWMPATGTWKAMADRGSITANHDDHVHISVLS